MPDMKTLTINGTTYTLSPAIGADPVATIPYTTGTAGEWMKLSTTFTADSNGLYEFKGSYSNAPVYGIAYSPTTATQIQQAYIITDSQTAGSVVGCVYLPAGTYAVWVRTANSAGLSNNVVINKVA